MQMLRTSMGPNKIISSAVPHQPWLGSDGAPSKDVKKFAEVMTYVNIMYVGMAIFSCVGVVADVS